MFVCEIVNDLMTATQKGMNKVRVKIFGKPTSGRRIYTGEQVDIIVTEKKANELTDKHKLEAELDELGF